ncbi:serine/threonine protein kinase HT1, putative [Entamoeba invadens IP1]|uniref:Serine/threonine protein kinase HT1, putative n=1 Tax=Entamoeba invadens IP1 TaxID=370355 RepID=A0A0A1U5K7_ENTIV|nr:serine/threonine protein kinase HT1, putative [Entamoeba invadens IP1]ELP89512.1 serine/threonine protein kinase HT1, putative [Entamoeba invadens IP1]|eukprot:XP_004256283.1 serine/threonine protein kinase HT1, putative [Entamoeba invadens IP1]
MVHGEVLVEKCMKIEDEEGVQKGFEEKVREVLNEIEVAKKCEDPNLLRMKGVNIEPLILVYEYCSEGSLYDVLSKIRLTDDEKLGLSIDVSRGVKALHLKNFIHRDIKSPNVLIKRENGKLRSVLADFGLCSSGKEKDEARNFNPIWTAPEVLQGKKCSFKSDVYSLSFVIWEIFTQKRPFGDIQFMAGIYSEVTSGGRPPLSCVSNEKIKNLCEEGWDENPHMRPNSCKIVKRLDEINQKDRSK